VNQPTFKQEDFTGPRWVRDQAAQLANTRGMLNQALLRAATPALPPVVLTSFRFEVLDADAFKRVEPGVFPERGVLRLAAPWTTPREIAHAGVPFLRLTPVDSDPEALDVTLALYRAILEDQGVDAAEVATSDRWTEKAEAWAAHCRSTAPRDVFDAYSGKSAAFELQIADRMARSFLVATTIPLPAKTLWPAGSDATRLGHDAAHLAEAERVAEAERQAAELAADVARLEAERTHTIGEVGIEVIAVQKSRPAADAAPFTSAALVWEDDTRRFYGFRAIQGLALPLAMTDGLEIMPPDTAIPPFAAPAPDPSFHAFEFAVHMRAGRADLDLAPIDDARWTDKGHAAARALAKEWSSLWLSFNPSTAWRMRWLCSALVRGYLVRPDLAELMIREATHVEEQRRHPPITVPSRFHGNPNMPPRVFPQAVPMTDTPNDTAALLCLEAANAIGPFAPIVAGAFVEISPATNRKARTK